MRDTIKSVADKNKEQAEQWVQKLKEVLDRDDPLFNSLRIDLRRI